MLNLERKGVINPNINNNGINLTEKKLNDVYSTINMVRESYKKLNDTDLSNLNKELNDVKNSSEKLNSVTNGLGNRIGKEFNNAVGRIQRFALSLISLRSIYSLISRASSQYLSQDTETTNRLQAAWIGLGSIFAPLLEKIANFAIKAVAYINVFVKALTGVDLLARATTKSMDKLNKSGKAASKTLAGFDEITNLNTDTSVANIDTSWVDAFQNVELNPNLVNALEWLADKCLWLYDNVLKPIGEWIWEHKDLVVGAIGAILAFKLGSKIGDLLGLIGGPSSGLIGGLILLDAYLIALAYNGVKNCVEESQKLNDELEQMNGLLDDNKRLGGNATEILLKNANATNKNSKEVQLGISKLFSWIDMNNKSIKSHKEQITWLGELTGHNDKWRESIIKLIEENSGYINGLTELYNRGILNEEQTKKLNELYDEQIELYSNLSTKTVANEETTKKYAKEVTNLYERKFALKSGYEQEIKKLQELNENMSVSEEEYSINKNKIMELQKAKNQYVINEMQKEIEKLEKANSKVGKLSDEYRINSQIIGELKGKIKDLTNQNYSTDVNINVNANTSNAKNKIQEIIDMTVGLANKAVSIVSGSINSYDVGTNYVPNDQLAYVHKGEAIVPKEFNSREFFSSSSSRTDDLLEELVDRFDNINFSPRISAEEIGEIAVNYIKRQRRITGTDVI